MIAPTNAPQTGSKSSSLFRTAEGKNCFVTFVLVTSLFLLWGFCNGMIDILNKHFQDTLHINKEQSGLVQFANYLAYFLMAAPAGLIARKFGYKGGILVGLTLIAGGAFWFVPATHIGAYWAFLLGLFVIASGMTCLETIANPYTTVMGLPESGATRINIAQTLNGVGWILGPIISAQFVFSGGEGADAHSGLSKPYIGIGIFVAILLVVFAFSKVPDLHAPDESKISDDQNKTLKPTSGQLIGIGVVLAAVWAVLYFFISPILTLVWALLSLPDGALQAIKYALIVAAYVASFMVVSKNWDLFRRKHYTCGVAAQFVLVAAQIGIFSFCVNYVIENDPTISPVKASKMLGGIGFVLFTVGRFCGSIVISQFKPQLVLGTYAVINVVLCGLAMLGGKIGLIAMFGTFFFMSIMFPTIFALGIRGLGEHTKTGSSVIVMAIVGGAVTTPFMGHIADVHSMRAGFAVPMICFVFVAIYGFIWQLPEAKDATK
jgi:MFS transporter, FHS family, L-fucose permease